MAELTKLLFLSTANPGPTGFQKVYGNCWTLTSGLLCRRENDQETGTYAIHCGRHIFYFGLVREQYRLIEFAVDPKATP